MLQLTERGRAYLVRHQESLVERWESREHVLGFLNVHNVTPVPALVDCLVELSGLGFTTPLDSAHFLSMRIWREEAAKGFSMAEATEDGWWCFVCESRYPGNIMLHESGSLHFEADLKALWFTSLGHLIEAFAFLDSIVGTQTSHKFVGSLWHASISQVMKAVGAEQSDVVADERRWIIRVRSGALVLLDAADLEITGATGVNYFTNNRADLRLVRQQLGNYVRWGEEK